MTPERWCRIKEVLDTTLACPAAEQQALLNQVCGDDQDLRREVASLAALEGRLGDFLERPARMTTEESSETERRIGVYDVLRRLSRGGMGTVYLAQRAGDERKQVALKVIRRDMETPKLVTRFYQERQILARLKHPNVVRYLDGGTTGGGRPYFVMEYVAGRPVDEYCGHHELSPRARIELFLRVCRAVRHLHRNLVIHLDLKPSNILVTAVGEPKLLDFGIAELRRGRGAARLPHPRSLAFSSRPVALTPNYASPEQIRGDAVTTASDVYSLGVLLHRLLTGSLPCRSDVDRRRLEGDLDRIVRRAIETDPKQRYSSVGHFSEDLRWSDSYRQSPTS